VEAAAANALAELVVGRSCEGVRALTDARVDMRMVKRCVNRL
jgi:hypothetical protein